MYAVVKTGGKQYRVETGSELIVERLAEEPGASITFDRVLLVGDGEAVTVGTPVVPGASVSGTVIGEELGPKLVIFKFKQKATYRRKNGHRQHLTRVRIDEISASGKKAKAEKAKAEKVEKAEASVDKAEASVQKPKRPRKPATKKAAADSSETKAAATEEPKRTRKPAASKAKAEE
ncbi:MAG: 50S ribosomal protein L21 [Candidatus Limnocylindria bacterium]